jgi:hypothetical protein
MALTGIARRWRNTCIAPAASCGAILLLTFPVASHCTRCQAPSTRTRPPRLLNRTSLRVRPETRTAQSIATLTPRDPHRNGPSLSPVGTSQHLPSSGHSCLCSARQEAPSGRLRPTTTTCLGPSRHARVRSPTRESAGRSPTKNTRRAPLVGGHRGAGQGHGGRFHIRPGQGCEAQGKARHGQAPGRQAQHGQHMIKLHPGSR